MKRHDIHPIEWIADFVRYYIGGLLDRIHEHHALLFASGLAFSLIICIIPLVLIVFAALGFVLEETSITQQVDSFIDGVVPYEDYATWVKEVVNSRLSEFSRYKGRAGLIGVLGLIFAASGLFSSIRTVLNRVFQVETAQSVFVGKLRDLGLILAVIIFVMFSALIPPGLELLKKFSDQLEWGAVYALSLRVGTYVLLFINFFVLYISIPQKRPPVRTAVVASCWATLLWFLAHLGFGYYLSHFGTIDRIYGTYALLIVLAFWIYYSSVLFVISAEIGQLYRERREARQILEQESYWFPD